LKQGAASLRMDGDVASARRLLEALYTRELDRNNLDASNFLGLAEVKLESGDAATAVALLRRMTVTTGEPFDTLSPAAALLARFNRNTEAIEFWQQRVKAVPWDFDAALHLARATGAVPLLRQIAANPNGAYEIRVEAANALAPQNATGLGSAELDALASTIPITVAAAERPYFFHARVKGATQTNDATARIRLLRGAIAINPAATSTKVQLFRTHLTANQFEQALAVFREQTPDVEDRATLAREMATAHRKAGNLAQAKRYLTLLANIDPKQDMKAEIAAVDAELRRIEANERRMPKIHGGIDQEQIVRPRV
jgi:Tfp pilus assembly protein PilF